MFYLTVLIIILLFFNFFEQIEGNCCETPFRCIVPELELLEIIVSSGESWVNYGCYWDNNV